MTVQLRSASLADLPVILHHRREMFREMGGKYKELLASYEQGSEDYFTQALQSGGYYCVLAQAGDQVVAGGGVVIAAWPGSPLNFEPKRAWILNIYVEPAYRRQGIARSITEHLIEWCRENRFQSVALHASEYGRELYQKLGFRPTNEMRLSLADYQRRP